MEETSKQNEEQEILTNSRFSETNKPFRKSCENVGIVPTSAQASKYRRKTGLVYRFGQNHKGMCWVDKAGQTRRT